MDIVEATKLIQEQATANGRQFSDELICISETATAVPSNIYDAFIVFHNAINTYYSYSANRARVEQLARDFENLPTAIKDKIYTKTFKNANTY